MSSTAQPLPTPLPEQALTSLHAACETGMYRDGEQELTRLLADPDNGLQHAGDDPRTAEFAARLGWHLMQTGRARQAVRRLLQTHPDLLATRTLQVVDLEMTGRSIAALEIVLQPDWPTPVGAVDLAKWHSARAGVFLGLRDFERAEQEIARGHEAWPEHPWLMVDRIVSLLRQDRIPAALRLCREQLERFPDYAPLRMIEAGILHDQDAEAAALDAWRRAHEQFQAPRISFAFANCLLSYNRPAEARPVLEQVLDNYRLPTRHRLPLLGSLAYAARAAGDIDACLEFGRRAGNSWHKMVEAIEANDQRPPRLRLPLPFVRQDHLTCVPAVMATILRYFDVQVDQREIADEITYDGTPDHEQLRWFEKRGMTVRFFEFDPAVAQRLLALGMPFTIVSRYPTSAHIQAVIGYDPLLRTFLLREPGVHAVVEVGEEDLLKQQRARGGGCSLVTMPAADGRSGPPAVDFELPREREHMASVLFFEALARNRWDEANEHLAVLTAMPPGPLRWDAERAIAYELREYRRIAELSRDQLAAAPDDEVCIYRTALAIRDAGLWEDQRAFLVEHFRKPECSPYVEISYAQLLSEHASTSARARRIGRMAARRLGSDGLACSILGSIHWDDRRQRSFAVELFRAASCQDPFDENRAAAYFRACDMLNRAEHGLAYLRRRFEEHGGRSPLTAGTLANALDDLHRSEEALAVLEAALDRHEDRWVRGLLFQQLLKHGELQRARQHLESSEQLLSKATYWQSVAELELACGQRQAALTAIEQAVAASPGDAALQDRRLDLLFELRGEQVATAATFELIEQNEHHFPLLRVAYDHLWSLGRREEAEALLRRMVAANPNEYWLQGMLGRHLLYSGRADEALALQLSLIEHSADSSALWTDIGRARALNGDRSGAREAFRRSLELNVDQSSTLYHLQQAAENRDQAIEDLRFLAERFRQRAPGNRILEAFLEFADDVLPDAERRGIIEQLARDYPGNADVARAHCEFLLQAEELDQAEAAARTLCERFPWLSDHHLLLARVLFERDEVPAGREVLTRLTERDPTCDEAFTALGESHEEAGEFEDAAAVFRRGIEQTGSPVLHGYLADLHWRRGRHDEALAEIARASELNPSYAWAHGTRIDWLNQLNRGEEGLQVARERVARSPTWPSGYRILARALSSHGLHEEGVTAMQRALELDPRLGDTRPELLRLLGSLGRFDEAREVARVGLELLGEDPELELESIRIERRAGDHSGSRTALRAMLDRHPDYQRGWVTLLSWHEEDGDDDAILALADEPVEPLLEIAPFYGYVADIRWRRDDHDRAEGAFREALRLDHDYQWARARLGALLHDAERYDDEAQVYSIIGDPYSVSPELACQIASNAAIRKEESRAADFFARALAEQDAPIRSLADTASTIRRSIPMLVRSITDAVAADDPHGFAEINIARLHAQEGRGPRFWRSVARIASHPEPAERTARLAAVLSYACHTEQRTKVAGWIHDNLTTPIEDVRLWGLVGWSSDDADWTIRTMLPDYTRPGAEGWMLANLADALFQNGEIEKMAQVSRHALTLPADHSKWWHRMYLAYERYRAGDLQECRALTALPVADYPIVRLGMRALVALVEIRQTRGYFARRRRLKSFAAELPELCKAVEESADQVLTTSYFAADLWRAIPCDLSLLLRFERGRRLLGA